MCIDIPHPRKTSKIIKHNHILQEIVDAYNKNQLHHAYIFAGIKGIGKATVAYNLVKLILTNNTKNHTNISDIHSSHDINLINNNNHPNLLVIEPEYDENSQTYNNFITIEQTKNIKEFLYTTSLVSPTLPKIVIIDAIDNLNINAANSILKILEEPSDNKIFFLICHNLHYILPTIVSRCCVKYFSPLSTTHIYEIINLLNLSAEHIKNINLHFNEGTTQELIWFLNPDNCQIYNIIKESIERKDINTINLLSKKINNLNSYNFRYLIENIMPQEMNKMNTTYDKLLDHTSYNIKLLLEQDKLFNLDKSSILISYLINFLFK